MNEHFPLRGGTACKCGWNFGLSLNDTHSDLKLWIEHAYDQLRAEAWDEGFEAGDQTARAVNPEWPEPTRNPYRSHDGSK